VRLTIHSSVRNGKAEESHVVRHQRRKSDQAGGIVHAARIRDRAAGRPACRGHPTGAGSAGAAVRSRTDVAAHIGRGGADMESHGFAITLLQVIHYFLSWVA
jgi:hypothetical protein